MQNHRFKSGFTIVELLIVVVVIAILAAITVISYNGITAQAKESSLKSDLKNNFTALESKKATLGAYPTSWSGSDIIKSSDNNVSYTYSPAKGGQYCIQAANGTLRYNISNEGIIKTGLCPPPARAWVSKGSSIAGGNYVHINVQNFEAGSYRARCAIDGTPASSYGTTYTIPTSGSVPLTCYIGSDYAGLAVSAEIEGWGFTESLTW